MSDHLAGWRRHTRTAAVKADKRQALKGWPNFASNALTQSGGRDVQANASVRRTDVPDIRQRRQRAVTASFDLAATGFQLVSGRADYPKSNRHRHYTARTWWRSREIRIDVLNHL